MEVAGLVIAVVPLIVSALKQYTEARRGVRRFKRVSFRLGRLILALQEQEICLETDLQQLLKAAGFEEDITSVDYEDVQAFILRSDVAAKLGPYMGKAYDPYIQALRLCEESVREVLKRIWKCVPGCETGTLAEIVKANKSTSGSPTLLQRMRFSLDEREIAQLSKEVDGASKRLRRLSKSAAIVHEVRSAPTNISKFTRFLQSVQIEADRLYSAVGDSLSSCCHVEHDTKLLLNDRLEQFKTRERPISFSLAIMSPSQGVSRILLSHGVQVDVLEDDASGGRNVVSTSAHEKCPQNNPQLNRISNICQSLNSPQMKSKLGQLYLLPDGNLSYSLVTSSITTNPNPLSLRVDQRPEQFFTLKRVLLQTADLEASPNAKAWSRDQRMALSFKLASSLLQLSSTPWLINVWTKEEICFMHLGLSHTNSNGALQFEVRHPFIIRRFAKIPEQRWPGTRATKRQMLELGILLLEIWQETALESWADSVGLTIQNFYGSRYDAVRKWLSESENVSVSYWDAVDRCIECAFPALPDWLDSTFRKSVCEWVVKPLYHNASCLTDQEPLGRME